MSLSYREKSIFGSLAAILVGYGYYFANVFTAVQPWHFNSRSVVRLMAAVFLIVVIDVVYQIIVAATSGPERKDERDTLIESRSYRNAYVLLAAAIFTLMAMIVIFNLPPYLIVNYALLSVVAAEVVKFLTQLFHYRVGL